MSDARAEQDNHAFEMSLRNQLIAAQNGQPPPQQPAHTSTVQYPAHHAAGSAQDQNLDPSIGGHHIQSYAMQPGGTSPEQQDAASKKKQRELSNTKRAAQNRAAQRAFRQRKEQYICKLEDDVKGLRVFEENCRVLQQENATLRTYIMDLQSKLLDAKIDFPAAPAAIHVPQPNPIIYDLTNDPEGGAHDASPTQPQSSYATQMSPTDHDQQRYHPSLREDSRSHQHQLRQQQHDDLHAHYQHEHDHQLHHPHNHPGPGPASTHSPASQSDDAGMPLGAIDQLRAAAAQAGELGDAATAIGRSRAGLPAGYLPAAAAAATPPGVEYARQHASSSSRKRRRIEHDDEDEVSGPEDEDDRRAVGGFATVRGGGGPSGSNSGGVLAALVSRLTGGGSASPSSGGK